MFGYSAQRDDLLLSLCCRRAYAAQSITRPPATCRYDIGVGPGKYGVHKTDSTFALIQAHAKVREMMERQLPAALPAAACCCDRAWRVQRSSCNVLNDGTRECLFSHWL